MEMGISTVHLRIFKVTRADFFLMLGVFYTYVFKISRLVNLKESSDEHRFPQCVSQSCETISLETRGSLKKAASGKRLVIPF